MGRQVGFFADDEDYRALLDWASRLQLRALPEVVRAGTIPTMESLAEFDLQQQVGHQSYFYLLSAEATTDDVLYERVGSSPELLKLCSRESPVIELVPCELKGITLIPGRIYLDNTTRNDPKFDVVRKAYDSLARQIKKWVKASKYRYYIGPHTASRCKAGTLNFSPYVTPLA